jgi:glycosyl transferase family 25
MEHIGGVYVINLDRRTDRLEEFQEEMDLLELPFKRFPGILKTPGTIGCGMSHLAILKEARDLGLKNVLIFEDDFMLQVPKEEFWAAVDDFFKTEKDYDVFLLAAWVKKKTDHSDKLFRVQEAQGASAYIVNSWLYDPLIELYEETLPKLEATGRHWLYSRDQSWKALQPEGVWLTTKKILGRQRPSIADTGKLPVFKDYKY